MAKKKNIVYNNYDIDFNSKYLVPMSRVGADEHDEELVECEVRQGFKEPEMGCFKDGYNTKRFYKAYFSHLLYIGYAKKVD